MIRLSNIKLTFDNNSRWVQYFICFIENEIRHAIYTYTGEFPTGKFNEVVIHAHR